MVTGLYNIFNARWGAQTIWLYSDPHFGETGFFLSLTKMGIAIEPNGLHTP